MSKELFDAINSNDINKVKELIQDDGVDLNAKNELGQTPLIAASQIGNTEIAILLIEEGADVNAKGTNKNTPLIAASNKGNIKLVTLLIEKEADVNAKNYFEHTPLILASQNGHKEIAVLLIENDAEINAKDSFGNTPLILASKNGHKDVAILLIENGANINAKSNWDYTPLILALQNGHKEIATLLIEKGADVNAKNNNKNTPLMVALHIGSTDIATLLLEKGADVNAEDNNKNTPLMVASQNGHTDIAALLIEKGAKVNAENNNGDTPLIYASKKGDKELVTLLIEKGANVNAKDTWYKTPLIAALHIGSTDIAALLIERGVDLDLDNTELRKNIINEINKGESKLLKAILNRNRDVFAEKDLKEQIQNFALINDNKEVLALLPIPPKPLTFDQKLQYRIKFALEESPNERKYSAFINIMNNIGIDLPPSLSRLINSNKAQPSDSGILEQITGKIESFLPSEISHYIENFARSEKSFIKQQIPALVKHYANEAMYKDLVNISEKFKIGKNHPVMEEVKSKLEILYSPNAEQEKFAKAAEDLKIILLRERLKHALPKGTDTHNFNKIIKQGVRHNLPPTEICSNLQTALLERGFEIDDYKLNRMCSNFVILRPVQDQASLHKRITQNVLNQLNEDFRVEMGATLDLKHTKFSGNEILYRGMHVNFSNKQIKDLFELGHRRLHGKNDLFLYDKQVKWSPNVGGWEGNAVYTSFDPTQSAKFLLGNGILIEFRPKPGELGIEGSAKYEYESEVLFNQLPHDDIKAIYRIKNNIITDIFENPYYEARENEPELSFKLNENFDREAKNYAYKGVEEYKKVQFNKNREQYSSPEDFESRYGPKEVEASRQRSWDERGYRTYREKFEQLPNENWPAVRNKPKSFLSNGNPISESIPSSAERRSGSFLFDTLKMGREYLSNHEASKAQEPQFETRFTTPEYVSEAFKLPTTLRDQYNLAKVMYKLGKDTVSYCADLFKDLNSEKVSKKEKEQLIQTFEKQLNQVVKTLEAIDKKLDHEQINIEEELQSYKQQSNGLLDKISKDKPIHKWLEKKVKEQKQDIKSEMKKLKVKTDKAVDLKVDHAIFEDKLAKLKESGELSKHSYDKIKQAKNKLIDSVKGLKDETSKPGKNPKGKASPSQGKK
jgi:cytohesin